MNPTKKLIQYINPFLDLIPDRFKEKIVTGNYLSATISISNPVQIDNKLCIDSKDGLITIRFNESIKTYRCNIFNYKKQIAKVWDDALRLIPDKGEIRKPPLSINQCVLFFFEPKTGIVLEIETMKTRRGWGEIYKVFETRESAVEYAKLLIQDKDIECTLLDSHYQFIQDIGK